MDAPFKTIGEVNAYEENEVVKIQARSLPEATKKKRIREVEKECEAHRKTLLANAWDSVLVAPRNNWHLGVTQVPGSTPSQQAQESWHNAGVMQRVKRELNASTEHVLNQTLPRLIALDGVPRHLAPCTIPCNFLLISCPKLPDPSDTRAIASL